MIAGAKRFIRSSWTRISLRSVHFADSHKRLDILYRIQDPWGMETAKQQFRFRETNRLIENEFGHVGSMLEIGCGEGHQSESLLELTDRLVGIDVSQRAVQRARARCPQAAFEVGGILEDTPLTRDATFDLVVACEVLYYIQDVESALRRLSQLGRACLVSYYDAPAARLDPVVMAIPGVRSKEVTYGETRWKLVWWRRPVSPDAGGLPDA